MVSKIIILLPFIFLEFCSLPLTNVFLWAHAVLHVDLLPDANKYDTKENDIDYSTGNNSFMVVGKVEKCIDSSREARLRL